MGQQEGINLLLNAAQHIVRDLNPARCAFFGLVGGGTELEAMQGFTPHSSASGTTSPFTGRGARRADVLAMLNTADVCVNPDIANEMNDKSTMNKIMEYMALGKPIVQFELTEADSPQATPRCTRAERRGRFRRTIVELLDDPEASRRDGRGSGGGASRVGAQLGAEGRSYCEPTTASEGLEQSASRGARTGSGGRPYATGEKPWLEAYRRSGASSIPVPIEVSLPRVRGRRRCAS